MTNKECCRRIKSTHIADSALEDCQVQVSRTAPISAIPVRSPSHGSEGCDGPADHRLLAGLARRSRLRRVRDEEAAGSNPATPTGNRQVTEHIVACRSHYTFPRVRFWEPVGSGQRDSAGPHGSCYNSLRLIFKGAPRRARRARPGYAPSMGADQPGSGSARKRKGWTGEVGPPQAATVTGEARHGGGSLARRAHPHTPPGGDRRNATWVTVPAKLWDYRPRAGHPLAVEDPAPM